jgi:hypothetical protein
VGFLDAFLGRSKPVPPDLDQLFALPSAALTLESATDFRPTGLGGVCFRAAEGAAFSDVEHQVRQMLDADGGIPIETKVDPYGWTWVVVRHDPSDVAGLVTDLHAVNASLRDSGFGPSLLASVVAFGHPDGRRLALVYLFKQGTFYPFAPVDDAAKKRDNALELQVRATVGADLRWEPDVGRWFPVWDAPILS